MVEIRVRARTLDMLGRQQIAGVPTAISELFKNSHDAYAHNVEVDFFRRSRLFVLRDDGIGMSYRDFVERWLTLGTESKLSANLGGVSPPPSDPSQASRPIMGEKGIGRLAIAAIGHQVLVLTRAKAPEEADHLVAAFIHWGAFSLPGVDLSAIQIPVRLLPGGTLPSADEVSSMVAEVRRNITGVAVGLPPSLPARILADLDRFDVVVDELYERLPAGPALRDKKYGTHFIILPTEETLPDDIDGRGSDDIAPPLIKVLVGFANTMTPGHTPATIQARFRDHLPDGTVHERIAGSAFFTPDEFQKADHHVLGEFDEFGQFRGTVQVYGTEAVDYLLPWPEAGGHPLLCGPLKISFAYVQGEARATKLPPEDHARLVAKLNRIGGLYIYRDGIRILPYGNSDYDFLNIEQRRTKKASYYFFSYRRIFGVIDITRDGNPNLVEKAGREGFRENRAYRQLKRLLENFFVQLAAEFFREGSLRAEEFVKTRDDLERKELLRRRRATQVRVRRAEFAQHLDAFFEAANAREPESAVGSLLEAASERFAGLVSSEGEDDVAQMFLDLEQEVNGALANIDAKYKARQPRGFGLTRALQRDWDAYRAERKRLEGDVFHPAAARLAGLVSQHAVRMRVRLDHRRRVQRAVEEVSEIQRKRARSLQRETLEEMERVQARVVSEIRDGLIVVEAAVSETVSELERTNTSSLDASSYELLRRTLEDRMAAAVDAEVGNLVKLREQLQSVGTEEGLEQAEMTDALEEELEALRERDLAGLQLAQVGMALGVVHHEFASTIQGVRNGLRRLKPWADANEKLRVLYGDIRSHFEHLDGYLTLFTPLDRRLQRRRVRIRGEEILQFLMDLFGERLERHTTELTATAAFREGTIVGFRSSFYPCFVNLVDNAIFWVTSGTRARTREIILDADGDALTVTDSGPGIRPRDAEAVFEMGFTRRPGGRGMGLYISRQALRHVGYDVTLDAFENSRGARFRISAWKEAREGGSDGGHAQREVKGRE